MTDAILRTANLSRRFGGLNAVDGVDLELRRGEVHAVLGPNGAGKSTLVNLLSGDLPPSAGSIHYDGREITGLPAHRVSQLGIGRSFQKTNIFPGLSCDENVWLAAQSRQRSSLRFFRPAQHNRAVRELTDASLARCGLGRHGQRRAGALSHGEQRQLEIGMVLATQPQLLLLDEPMAGMGREESEQLVALIKDLSRDYSLLLIEHDMDAVFAVADRLTVMVNGRVIASGDVATVRASREVQEAYLGGAAAVGS